MRSHAVGAGGVGVGRGQELKGQRSSGMLPAGPERAGLKEGVSICDRESQSIFMAPQLKGVVIFTH